MKKKINTLGYILAVFLILLTAASVEAQNCVTQSATATWSAGDSACIYDAGSTGILADGIDSENPTSTDCGQFNYLDLETTPPTLSYYPYFDPLDSTCNYICPPGYALVKVVAEDPYSSSDCNQYQCRYIGCGGDTYTAQSTWNAGDSACTYSCPEGFALQKFYAEDPSFYGGDDCNYFTCQEVTNCPTTTTTTLSQTTSTTTLTIIGGCSIQAGQTVGDDCYCTISPEYCFSQNKRWYSIPGGACGCQSCPAGNTVNPSTNECECAVTP
ncbi:MAG: hypothetical protein ABH851_04820, partial [Methanobacteriota archaeon]